MNTMNLNSKILKPLMWLSLLFISFALSNTVQAKLTQSIDRTDIHAGESFILTIQLDQDTGAEPDLSMIPKEFTIISNSQYQQMSYINGESNTIKGWKLKLSTLKTGRIVIPAIPVGKDKTKPIVLNIKDTSDRIDLSGQQKAIYLESMVDTEKVYVQQQIVFTVKLYRAVNTHYARLTEPSAGDSIIEKLGDDLQYDKRVDNTRYVVTERRYAIFPQKSGELTIDSINFTADVNDPNRRGSNRFLNTTRPISVNSKSIKINVQPQPTTADNPWMPATEVVLADKWSSNNNQLTVGEPVTWTLLLYAQGLSESQIPEITLPKVEGLQFYPDSPQKERQVNEKGILGQRVEKLAVIPSKQGEITIPSIKLSWWDVKSDSQKTASLPAKTFKVLPAVQPQGQATSSEQIAPVQQAPASEYSADVKPWQIATLIFALLWGITLVGFFLRGSSNYERSQRKARKKVNAKDLVAPMTQSELYQKLLKAIKSQQLAEIEKLLLRWVSKMSKKPIYSIGQLKQSITEQTILSKLSALETTRYAANSQSLSCDLSKQELELIAQSLIETSTAPQDSIPPLYN
jgi:hypothetical protein